MKDILIMGIESSCDETSVAVVKNGREVLSNVINSQIKIKAPLIVLAIGQELDLSGLSIAQGDLYKENLQVGNTNVFMAGDIAFGDKSVVYAVRTGKEACKAVMNYLQGGKR